METIAFGDSLVLLDHAGGRLLAYNSGARAVWDALAAGAGVRELTDDILSGAGDGAEELARQVGAIAEHWREEGLLVDAAGPASAAGTGSSVEPAPRPLPPNPRRWAVEWSCQIAGLRIQIASERARDAEGVGALLRHLRCEDGAVDLRLEIRDAGPGGAALLGPVGEILRSNEPGLITGAINQAILERLYPGVDWLALVHAGAVALDGRAVVLPAPSGSGKTTLTAALIAGGFDYLADDLAAIMAPEGKVAPWRAPLSIKSGSWSVLEFLHPRLAEAPVYATKGLRARLLTAEPDRAVGDEGPPEPVLLAALVFPRYVPGAATRLQRLAPVEALSRLLNDRIWLGHPLTRAGVERFLAWLERTPAYSLEYDRLDEAQAALVGVLRP